VSGEPSAYPDGFQPGSVLAGYRLEALVGVGGMAVVWRARSLRLDRPVALKILASALATDEAFRQRFIAEARAAALVDDPHIIPVYDADEADGVLFIAMRFVGGGDLRRLVEREGALSPARAVEFISPVASALDAAHAAGLVHRDVKPANILVDARAGRPDHVYLSDFGIAKAAVSMNLTAVGQALGTPDYMAPEQIEGKAVDGRTDQYALACVTYRLLTQHGPFERESALSVMAAHLYTEPPSLQARRPDLPAAADQVLAKAMAKSPADRYESCGDFAEALRQALDLAPYIPRPHRAQPVPARPGAGGSATPQPASLSPWEPRTPTEPPTPTPTEVPVRTEPPARTEAARTESPTTPAQPSTEAAATSSAPPTAALAESPVPTVAATRSPAAPASASADAIPPSAAPGPSPASPSSPAAAPPAVESHTMTITPSHGVGSADIVARPEPPPDAEPVLAPGDPAADVDRRTPTVTALSTAPAPAPVPAPVPAPSASHPITEVAEPRSLQEPRNAPSASDTADTADTRNLPDALLTPDAPGTSDAPGESAEPEAPDEPEAQDQPQAPEAEAAVGSDVQHAPPEVTQAPAAQPARSGLAPDAAATPDTAEDAGTAYHAGTTAEIPAPSAATTLPVLAAPDGPKVQAADEYQRSKTPDTVYDAAAATAEQNGLTDPRPASDAAPTVVERPPDRADRPDETTIWSRHRRLTSVAVGCAVAVLAAAVPFTLISRAHSPGPAPSPTTAHSPSQTSSPQASKTPGKGSSAYTFTALNLPAAYRGTLSSMAFSPDGATLAIAGGAGAGEACLWNIATHRCRANFPVAHSIAFSPNGTTLAVTDSDSGTAGHGSIRLWDVATGKPTGTLTDLQSQGAYSAAFSVNGKTLVVGDADDSIYLWDVATRTQTTRIVNNDQAGFTAVACSPDGATMAAGDIDGTTHLVNIVTKQSMFTVTTSTKTTAGPHPVMVNSVAFSHDGASLAIGDINGTIVLINVETKSVIATVYDPGGKGVESVAFSPDDAILAVADANGSTYLWNVADRKIIAALADPGGTGVTSVAFSPNGKILATGDENGGADLWYGDFR